MFLDLFRAIKTMKKNFLKKDNEEKMFNEMNILK